MPKVIPVNLKFCMIKHVDELMHHGLFQVFLVQEVALTKENGSKLWRKSSGTCAITRGARKMLGSNTGTSKFQVLHHERHSWAYISPIDQCKDYEEEGDKTGADARILTIVEQFPLPLLAVPAPDLMHSLLRRDTETCEK